MKGKVVYKMILSLIGLALRGTQVFEEGELWLGLGPDNGLSGLDFKYHTRASPAWTGLWPWPWAWAWVQVWFVGWTIILFYRKFIYIFLINFL